jgi:hypothetical protein
LARCKHKIPKLGKAEWPGSQKGEKLYNPLKAVAR